MIFNKISPQDFFIWNFGTKGTNFMDPLRGGGGFGTPLFSHSKDSKTCYSILKKGLQSRLKVYSALN